MKPARLLDEKTMAVELFFPDGGEHTYRTPWDCRLSGRYRVAGGEVLVVEVDARAWHKYRAELIRKEYCIDLEPSLN